MSKISFVNHYGEQTELNEAYGSLPLRFEIPVTTEGDDSMYENVFREAQGKLGLGDLEPVYEGGQKRLLAPEGLMFCLTGAFTLWPDGNDIEWGYGAPMYSYKEWQRQCQEKKEKLMSEHGLSAEAAQEAIEEDEEWGDDHFDHVDTDLSQFFGKSITMSYNRVSWGSTVNPERVAEYIYDEDKPVNVEVGVQGFQETWFEQARRYIKLPNSATDKLLNTYEYGMPGSIPCYQGQHCKGDLEHIVIELVPVEEGIGDVHHSTLKRLWVPESVRYYLDERYPDLIDQGSDYETRSDFGHVMRTLGRIAAAIGGRKGNVVDEIAEKSKTKNNIVVVDDPIVAHMNIDKLATQIEQAIQKSNEQDPSDGAAREREREEKIRRDIENKKRRLVVITGVDEPIDDIAKRVGQDDSWLEKHVRYINH
jgi:NACalpha-BTF3-like transcription factor